MTDGDLWRTLRVALILALLYTCVMMGLSCLHGDSRQPAFTNAVP